MSWHPTDPAAEFLVERPDTLVASYRRWVTSGAYSVLLFDGALLQLSFDFEGGQLVKHRLGYVPCPVAVDEELLQVEPVLDVLDMHLSEGPDAIRLNAAVRFDYDLEAASEAHPASHLTLNGAGCRIACRGPLRLAHFVEFIFANFYPALWDEGGYFTGMPRAEWGPRTLTPGQTSRLHIDWRDQTI